MSVEYDELNPGQSFDALEAENARLRNLLKMSLSNINWRAVASWLRKEAGDHLKRADVLSQARPEQSEHSLQCVDVFMGLARAIEYGMETQQLAEAKDRFFGSSTP